MRKDSHVVLISKRRYLIPNRYASQDGIDWQRNNEYNQGPEVSLEGWDSDMVAYPHVFKMEKTKYMLYCGNGWSKEGFGIARFD